MASAPSRRQVFLKCNGDPGRGQSWEIHDAGSHQPIQTVTDFALRVGVNAYPTITLTFINGATETCDVVPDPSPVAVPDGAQVVLFELSRTDADSMLRAYARRFEVNKNKLVPVFKQDLATQRKIVNTGKDMETAAESLGLMLGGMLSHEVHRGCPTLAPTHRHLLGGVSVPKGASVAGAVPTAYFNGTPNFGGTVSPAAAPTKTKCGECGGTGFYISPLSGRRDVCSRGCKP